MLTHLPVFLELFLIIGKYSKQSRNDNKKSDKICSCFTA